MQAVVRSKEVFLLFLINCLLLFPLFILFLGVCVWSLFYYSVISFFTCFAIILTGKRELVVLLELFSWCIVTVSVLWLFPAHDAVGWSAVIDCFCFLFLLLHSDIHFKI